MRVFVVSVLVAVGLMGCFCKRCYGQEAKAIPVEEAAAKPVVMTSTEVMQWKVNLFDGLNQIKQNPYDTVADLLLINGFGLSKIPNGKETVEVSHESFTKMQKVIKSIKVILGFALIQQAQVLEENREAVQAAIESATDTIKDDAARKAFLEKALLLNKE